MTVGLVIVSHSSRLAEGVAELAIEMAPNVRVLPAGGLPDGTSGTDFEKVATALSDANSGSGVVLLYDLGSAQMIADLAVEQLGDPSNAIVSSGPLVEGAVAAAVAAQGENDLEAVAQAADAAAEGGELGEPAVAVQGDGGDLAESRAELVLQNEVGLHARPAALLARSLTGLQADVSITLGDKNADAASVLGVMGLGARKGDRIAVHATGPDAKDAVRRIQDLADRKFGE